MQLHSPPARHQRHGVVRPVPDHRALRTHKALRDLIGAAQRLKHSRISICRADFFFRAARLPIRLASTTLTAFGHINAVIST
jgi:hypothetical protein